jgi:capsular polysaccharide biosynthesis protein
MLQQIPLKQRYSNNNTQKLKEKKKKEFQKLVKTNRKKLLLIAIFFLVILSRGILQQFFFKGRNYQINQIVIREQNRSFDTDEIQQNIQEYVGQNYRKTRNNLLQGLSAAKASRVEDILPVSFQDNIRTIEVQYASPEIIFFHGDKQR